MRRRGIDQPGAAARSCSPAPFAAPPVIELDSWLAEHDAAFATGARRRFVRRPRSPGSSTLPPPTIPVCKEGRDLELPPWNKGRYGTAIGRAVHAVLQTVDLATGAGSPTSPLRRPRPRACSATSRPSPARAVRARSPTVARACAAEYWRETYVAVPVEGSRSRVTSTWCTATGRPARVWSSSTTRPTRSPTTRCSRPGSRTIGCRAPRTRSRSPRPPATASTVVSSCSSRRPGCARSRSRAPSSRRDRGGPRARSDRCVTTRRVRSPGARRRLIRGRADPGGTGRGCAILVEPVRPARFTVNFVLTVALGATALATSLALLVPAAARLGAAISPMPKVDVSLKTQPQRSYVFDSHGR